MKKKFLYLIIALFCFILVAPVSAEEIEQCSLEKKTALRVAASNVTISYQPVEVKPKEDGVQSDQQGVVEYWFDVKVYNLNTDLKVVVKKDNGFNTEGVILTYRNMDAEGAATYRVPATNKMSNLVFEVKGSDDTGICAMNTLRTIKLTLPKYNNFAEREVCSEVPEFYMCQKYITYDINPNKFTQEINEYKKKKEEQNNASNVEIEDNNTLPDKAADLIAKNKYIIVGTIVLAGVIITVIILRRKKSVL